MNLPVSDPASIDWPTLLEQHEQGPSFFFATPNRTLLVPEPGEPLFGCAADELALLDRVQRAFSAGPSRGGLLVGALPFFPDEPAQLALATHFKSSGPWFAARRSRGFDSARFRDVPEEGLYHDELYKLGVTEALRLIARRSLDKVVLAQMIERELPSPPHAGRLLQCLRSAHPRGFAFCHVGSRGTLIGSSPELLVAKHGESVRTTPLAGSRPRPETKEEEERWIDELLSSSKDLHEHRVVVDQITARLRQVTEDLRVSPRPVVFRTASMLHLGTPIAGRLRGPQHNALSLVLALHPTAAVCGFPTDAALRFIEKIEGNVRGLFGGALGYMDEHGDGEWIVTLRCAEIDGCRARLFAGAGIVESSDPESEMREVKSKMATMLRALREVSHS